ncbi:MAG: hypothetical protein C4536_03935 [Actinobacteria bacterium]|jgi:predicted dienelactone hydrolase|nr:MAG: hypothetical protein C4536_03935 [Actinomycetota bacterium]
MKKSMKRSRMSSAITAVLLAMLAALTALAGCASAETAREEAGDGLYNVALRIMYFDYAQPGGGTETVTAAVWYPATDEPQIYVYKTSDDYRSRVALDSPLDASGAPYPLVFFAHGAYGCGYDSAFFCEYLAARGYVVVAPDFVDTRAPMYSEQIAFARVGEGDTGSVREVLAVARQFVEDMDADRALLFSYLAEHRLDHVSFVVDMMAAENATPSSFLYGAIDEKAMGICGHSLGGVTSLGKIGAHPDGSFQDGRFKAALLFSAPAYPFEESLQDIDVPMMLMVGDDDPPFLHPELPRRATFDGAPPPRYLAIVRNADHFAFSNRVCGSAPLYEAVEDNPQVSAICRYGYDFMQAYLLGSSAALTEIEEPDPAFVFYAWEEQAGEPHAWGEEPPP